MIVKLKRPLFIIAILQILVFEAFAQTKIMSENKKALKYFDEAKSAFGTRQLEDAEFCLQKAIKEDPGFLEAYLFLGEVKFDMKKLEESIDVFRQVTKIKPDYRPKIFYRMASLQMQIGKYANAGVDYQNYLSQDVDTGLRKEARYGVKHSRVADSIMRFPVPFEPINLGENINTSNGEYSPSLTADEQTLVITRVEKAQGPVCPSAGGRNEDFYVTTKEGQEWSAMRNMGPPLNTNCNEGAQCISPDGKYMFFAACERPDGIGKCDLYWSKKEGNRWTTPQNMGKPVNSEAWDSQPSFSSDGKTLYFVSNRSGGFGKSDIWKTELQGDGSWSKPLNLGPVINTEGQENSPFIHLDDQTLYFASDKHFALGSLDLFYSRKDSKGEFTKPINIGYPINTLNEERSLIINTQGNRAYFASNTLKGFGDFDVFVFDLYPGARPNPVTYLKGKVFDNNTKLPLESLFELVDIESGQQVAKAKSDATNGEFLVCLPTNKNYALSVWKDGYLFHSENFSLKGNHLITEPYKKDIGLGQIEKDKTVVLKNIFFDTNLWDLKPESTSELNILLKLLNDNKTIKIEISGHTDNRGSKESNLKLSDNRAKAVFDFLVKNGISASRLTFKGYGDAMPIADNNNEEGRAINRRTEFKVIGF